jgi:hypothetical protein
LKPFFTFLDVRSIGRAPQAHCPETTAAGVAMRTPAAFENVENLPIHDPRSRTENRRKKNPLHRPITRPDGTPLDVL